MSESIPSKSQRSPYLIAESHVPYASLVPTTTLRGGALGAKVVYGLESSIIIATRDPGYHSTPHKHDAEQLNFVLAGELYIFIENEGFLAKRGDLFRIPRDAIHWSWVQGGSPCTLLEVHTPPLIGEPVEIDKTVALLASGESRASLIAVPTQWPSFPGVTETESKVLREWPVR